MSVEPPEPLWPASPTDRRVDPEGTGPFYADALQHAAGWRYRHALRARGFDGEIALLRLRLHTLLAAEQHGDPAPDAQLTAQVLRIVDLLIKASRAAGTRGEDQAALEEALEEEALRVLAMKK